MMIGPWTHSGGYGGKVHEAEILRWYDYWLKGIQNGIMDEEPIHYFVMEGNNTTPPQVAGAEAAGAGAKQASAATGGAETPPKSADEIAAEDGNRWVAARDWPIKAAMAQRFALDGGHSGTVKSVNDGVLLAGVIAKSTDPHAATPRVDAGSDRYQVDYGSRMGSFSRWMNGYGSRRKEPANTTFFDERTPEDAKALTWTTPALAEPITIVGYPIVHLMLSSDHQDGDVFAYLEEIDEHGAAHYVSEGVIRASHRKLDLPPWSNFNLPWHRSLKKDLAPLTPKEPAALDFDLEGTAIVIDAGHRIRLTVAGADRANYELWPDPNGKDRPTITIYRGGADASYLELPVVAGGGTT
jgi:putative CocE/NonD family hydrolase